MAAEIKSRLGLNVELIEGGGGVFDLRADDQMVFSKHAENDQLPDHDDVVERLSNVNSK